jgi:hypothetical protein
MEKNAKSDEFAFSKVFNRFLKLILPQILSIVTHIFNTILTISIYPAAWKTSKIMPIAKKNEPNNMSYCRQINVLPALSKAIEIIMK